jgi:hypothetical protein
MSKVPLHRLNPDGASDQDVVTFDAASGDWIAQASTGGSGLTIQDENGTVATGVTQIDIQGAGAVATSGTGEVVITIPGYTDEQARDALGAALVAGSGISIAVNDGADTITITATGGGVGSGANNIGYDTEIAATAYTTITLDSTPVTNGEQVFIDGRLLSKTADYTISGAVITLVVPVFTLQRVTVQWQTTAATPGGFTLSGTPGSPTVRASAIQYVNNAASQGIAFPSGTAVGDRAVLFAAHGFAISATPTGWAQLDLASGSNFNGAVYTKLIDSADLTAGSVTVSFGGTYYGELALAVMAGGTAGVRETKTVRSSTGASPNSLTTVSSAAATDTALYFGSIRTTNSTTTVNRGTSLQSRAADTEASAALYSEDLSSSGTVTAQFSHSPASNGYYEAIVILKGV